MHTSSIFSERFNRSSDFKPYKKEERVLLISNLIKQRFQSIGRWSRRHHRRLFLWHAFNGQVLRLKSFLIAYEIHQINMEDSISLLQHIVRCHHVFFIVISYALQWSVFSIFRIFALQHLIGHLHIGIIGG